MSTCELFGASLGLAAFSGFLAVCGYANSYRLTKQLLSVRATLQQIAALDTTHHAYTAARLAREGLRACSDTN